MQRRMLIIAIYDPKWFMKVLEILRRRDILFNHYYSRNSVPYGSIVYTDFEYIRNELSTRSDLLVIYDPDKTCRKLEDAILASLMLEKYRYITVGIDPGPVLSYVVLGDDILLLYGEGEVKDLNRDLTYVYECMSFDRIIVRIGMGSKAEDVLVEIKDKYNVVLELVDESGTTPSQSKISELIYASRKLRKLRPFRHRGIYAAYRIALSKGVEVL